MLSTSFDSPDEHENGYLREVNELPSAMIGGSLQDDVEGLIEIAAKLFSAIERQIHCIEEELVIACGEHVRTFAQTVFKERLISCAQNLDTSLQEIALNLEQRSIEQTSRGTFRDKTYI
jgi:hypothetical protein